MGYRESTIEDTFSKDEKVEVISYTEVFRKACPIFMSYGMTYDAFWKGDPFEAQYCLKAYKLKVKHEDELMWEQGMYIYEAILDCSPILHPFSKATKPLPYAKKPYTREIEDNKKEKKNEEQVEYEKLRARIWLDNWVRNTQQHFKNKEGV